MSPLNTGEGGWGRGAPNIHCVLAEFRHRRKPNEATEGKCQHLHDQHFQSQISVFL